MALAPAWTFRDSVSQLDDASYTESKDSKSAGFTKGNSSIERVFIVQAGTDNVVVRGFVDDLLGYASWDVGGAHLVRILPDEHPCYPKFYAHDVKIEGYGIASKTTHERPAPEFELYRVTALYAPTKYYIRPDDEVTAEYQRFCSFDYKQTVQYLTVGGNMYFLLSGRTLASPPGKLNIQQILTIRWHDVPALSDNPFLIPTYVNIIDNVGRTNEATFFGNPPSTVLFLGAEGSEMQTPALADDKFYWTIQYNFGIKNDGTNSFGPCGWNTVFDVTSGEWDVVTSTGGLDGHTIYPTTGDFERLFWTA